MGNTDSTATDVTRMTDPSSPTVTPPHDSETPSAERLLWLAAKVQAQHQFVFEGSALMYNGKNRPEHNMLTCAEDSHAGCHIRAFVEGVRMFISDACDPSSLPSTPDQGGQQCLNGHVWSSDDCSYRRGEWEWRCDCGELERDFPPASIDPDSFPVRSKQEP